MDLVETAHENLQTALAGGNLDVDLFEQLTLKLRADAALRAPVQRQVLPGLVELVLRDPEAAIGVPESFIDAVFTGEPIAGVLAVIPPEAYSHGLKVPVLQNVLIELLARVDKSDLAGPAGGLVREAIALVVQPDVPLGPLERLATRLAVLGALAALVPFAALHTGSATLRSRLMALNVLLVRQGADVPAPYISWPPDPEDVLLNATLAQYLEDLLVASDAGRRPDYYELIAPSIDEIAKSYAADREGIIANTIESLLVVLARTLPTAFGTLDARHTLVTPASFALLARLPPPYLEQQHADLVRGLRLSAAAAPAYANLATYEPAYRLLHIDATTLDRLPVDVGLLIALGASKTQETAHLFAGTYPVILERLLAPATLPGIVDMQTTLRLNLRAHNIQPPREAPAVATSHGE